MSLNHEVKSNNISTLQQESRDYENRISNLEGGADTSNSTTEVEQKFAKLVNGGDDNIAKFWKVRHHVTMSSLGNGANPEGADFEDQKFQDRFMTDPSFSINSSVVTNAQSYLSTVYYIEQNEQFQFKIKKGENFFWIGTYLATANTTVFRVYVDGINVNTLGLVDENGNTVPSFFSANSATTVYGKNFQFYGLDGEQHLVTIRNESAVSGPELPLNYVDVGYRLMDFAMNHTMRINSGVASVNGVPTQFDSGTFTFARPAEGLVNGYTGMITINQDGQLAAVNGLSPASTEVKPQQLITFASSVTSLPVKNHFAFPDYGICLLQHPSGENFLFSYGSKAQTGGPQTQTLEEIIWQSKPFDNYTPLISPPGTKEVMTATNPATSPGSFFDVAGAAKKLIVYSSRPNVGHYFWFKVTDGVNTQVDPGGTTNVIYGHQVNLLSADTNVTVASKLAAAINSLTDYFTASVASNVVTITCKQNGDVTVIAASTSGMTIATPTAGVNPQYLVNGWRGDLRIEHWAKPTIHITSANNKIDFQVTVNGVTTAYTATLANGWYSADLVPIETNFINAMKAQYTPARGDYFLKYSDQAQYWTIGVTGDEQTEIRFLWASGTNNANSFGPTIGFSTDCTGATNYVATTPKQHNAQRVFVADQSYRPTEHPSIKYSWAISGQTTITEADQLLTDLGLPSYRRQASAGNQWEIYPDDDCCGLTLSFMREDVSVYVTYQVDNGDIIYLPNMGRSNDTGNPAKGALINSFISFPKGSRKITIRPEYNIWFQTETDTTYITFFGYRQWFTKPPWESLALTEKVLKTVEVNPLRLYATNYGHTNDLYYPLRPDVAFDANANTNTSNITSLAEWYALSFTTSSSGFNLKKVTIQNMRQSGTPVGTIICEIYSDSGGSPGTLLGSGTILNFASLGTGFTNQDFFFSGLALAASTTYHIVIRFLTYTSGTLTVGFGTNSYSGGSMKLSNNSGGSYSVYGGQWGFYVWRPGDYQINSVVESGFPEITNLTNANVGSFFDVAGTAKNFSLYAAPVGTTGRQHYFWFKVTSQNTNTQTDPALAGAIGHRIDVVGANGGTADSALTIATKIRDAINLVTGEHGFTAVLRNPASAVVTVTNNSAGAVTNAANGAVTAGLTIAVESEGVNHWTQTAQTTYFNQKNRQTATYGAYVDISFTLQGDGGGFALLTSDTTGTSQAINFYLSNNPITEASEPSDLIELSSADSAATVYDFYRFMHIGLKAGTYYLRIRNDNTQTVANNAFCVIDTVAAQRYKHTHTDLYIPGQGLSYPVNVKRRNFQRYSVDRQPSWLTEGQAKIGLVNMTDYITTTHTVNNYDDASTVITNSSYFFSSLQHVLANTYFQLPFVGRSVAALYGNLSTYCNSITPYIDGVSDANISQAECVKGGLSPSATRTAACRLYVFDFEWPVTFSSGNTFLMTETLGIRNNKKIILEDNLGNLEEAYVLSFVNNTSFTIKKPLNLIHANIVRVYTHGFHTLKLVGNNASIHHLSAIEYEPMPLEWSILENRVSTVKKEEIKQLNYIFSTSLGPGAGATYTFEYPFHSDGEQGTPLTSELELYSRAHSGGAYMDRALKTFSAYNGNDSFTYTITSYLNVRSRRSIFVKATGIVRG